MSLPPEVEVYPVLVRVLAAMGGRARPSEIYPRVTGCFPDISPEDLTATLKDGRTNRWQNRIAWARQRLVGAGIQDPTERGVWKLTEKGNDLAASEAVAGGSAFLDIRASVPRLPGDQRIDQAVAPDKAPALGTMASILANQPELFLLEPQARSISSELNVAARDSRDPDRFERALAAAFAFLGFEIELLGGPGKTDVLLRAPLGIRGYSVVVDAKSTGRSRVAGGHVDVLSIRSHREQERADHACLVGVDFAGGQLTSRAMEFQVTLLAVEELAELVNLHAETPLTLTELRAMFLAIPFAKAALPQLKAAARERRRKRLLISRLLSHIDNVNRAQPGIVLAKPETLLASTLAERNADLQGTTLEDVRRTLLMLETIGIVSAQNGEGYVSDTSVTGAKQLLTSFLSAPAGAGERAPATSRMVGRPQ